MLIIFPPPPTAVEMNGVHVDDFLPPQPTTVEMNGVLVDYFLPPPPTTVEMNGVPVDDFPPPPPTTVAMNGVYVDNFLPPPSSVRVELNKTTAKGFLVPTRTRRKTRGDLRPQGEVSPTSTVKQCAEPTILVPSSIFFVPPHAPCC